MFRGSGITEMNEKHVGVGSIIKGGPGERWLFVRTGDKYINVINLSNFTLISAVSVAVEDVHFISKEEAEAALSPIGEAALSPIGYTFSDFEFDCKGLKFRNDYIK